MTDADRTPTTRVLVVDDLPDIRQLLRTYLGLEAPWLDVSEAVDGEDALRVIDLTHPDVVVIDLAMPRLDGLAAIPQIAERSPETRIVIFSAFPPSAMGDKALDAGAHAYHEKTDRLDEVTATITRLARTTAPDTRF